MARRLPGLVLLLGVLGQARLASGADLEGLLARLTEAGRGTRSIQASFVQRKRLKLFRSEVTTQGRMAFARPDRLRWETFAPDASVLVVAKERAELRIPGEPPRAFDLRQDRTMGTLVEQLMMWLGARPARDLHRWYRATLGAKDEQQQLALEPKDPAFRRRVRLVEVTLGPDLMLRQIRVEHADGDESVIAFSDVRRNAPLSKDAFR